jgi:hypothetical protein
MRKIDKVRDRFGLETGRFENRTSWKPDEPDVLKLDVLCEYREITIG